MDSTSALRDELTQRLLDHARIVAVTGNEGPLTDVVADTYRARGDTVDRIGHSLVITPPDSGQRSRPTVVLVGHLDVVAPTDDDRQPHLTTRDGTEIVVARGASDMKSGNVVAMSVFEDPRIRADAAYDVVLVLYAGEEGPADGNELAAVLAAHPELTQASLAVILEPTDGNVELGCLGGIHAQLMFHGRQAHSARPWQGDNALTAAARFLTRLAADDVRDVVVDGIAYRDVWSATQAWTDPAVGRNVIPGRCTVNVNFRFAPSRSLDDAVAELSARVTSIADVDVDIDVVDRAPPAPPHRHQPAVAAFIAALGLTDDQVRGKQAWTDVARFAQIGVPALNFGPGLTAQAHQRGEWVPVDAMVAARQALARSLATAPEPSSLPHPGATA